MLNPDSIHRVREISAAMTKRCLRVCVPVFVFVDDGYRTLGTGTLLAIDDSHFLVTAYHVVKRATDSDKGLSFMTWPEGRIRHVGPCPVALIKSADVAVLDLDSKATAGLTSENFLRLPDLASNPVERRGLFYLSGYPEEINPGITRAWCPSRDQTCWALPATLLRKR